MATKISNTNSLVPAYTLSWVVDAAIGGHKDTALAALENCGLSHRKIEKIKTIFNTFQSNGDSREFQSLKDAIVNVLNYDENLDFSCEDTIYELSLQCLSTGGISSALTLACTCKKFNQFIIPYLQKLKDDALLAMWKQNQLIRTPVWPIHLGIEGEEAMDAFYEDRDALNEAYTRVINAQAKEVRDHLKDPFNPNLFSSISHIDITKHEIKIIPHEITFMNLTHIDLRHNKIRFIPEFLGNFEKLKYLNLSNNLIANVPACIIDKLCDGLPLQLEGNPLLFIPEKGLCPKMDSGSGHPLLFCLWFSKFNNYDDPSRFSKFIRLCLSDTTDKEKIETELKLFKAPMKSAILTLIRIEINHCTTSAYDQWPHREACIVDGLTIDNADLFCKALRNVLDKV